MRSLAGYILEQKLGEGGMGEVWLARRPTVTGVDKRVAIKLVAGRHAHSEKLFEMFLQEARLSMQLSHSNIVQVFDVIEADETCFMVMEYVDGLTLAQLSAKLRASKSSFSHAQTAFIIAKLLRALAYAHELDQRAGKDTIVHRDVSPQNVMLSASGEVKLMDFGIARMSGDDTSGAVRGKPRYMPPEQLAGRTRELTVDLFAVGAILHELLDGKVFRSQVLDDGELYGMILEGRVPPLECGPVPEALDALRRGLLEAKVERRIPSARAALQQLSAWSGARDVSFELESLVREFIAPLSNSGSRARPAIEVASTRLASDDPGVDHATDSLLDLSLGGLGDSSVVPTVMPSDPREAASEETISRPLNSSRRPVASIEPSPAPQPPLRALVEGASRTQLLIGLGVALFLIWGVLVLWALVGGGAPEQPDLENIEWSACESELEGIRTCADICAAQGGSCVNFGCSGDAGTNLVRGASELVCTGEPLGSYEKVSCDQGLATVDPGESVRCCCDGLSGEHGD